MKRSIEFHHGSRDLYPDERSVVEAVEKAVEASVAKHGKPRGAPLFKASSEGTSAPSVHIIGDSPSSQEPPQEARNPDAPLMNILRRLSGA